MDGRRDKAEQRLSNGSKQVPGPLLTSPRPPVGGERVTGHGRHLVFRLSATRARQRRIERTSGREAPTRHGPRVLNMCRASDLTLVSSL